MEKPIVTQKDIEHEILRITLNNLAKRINIKADFKDIPLLLICISEALKLISNVQRNKDFKGESGIVVPKTVIKGDVN
jgi:hypothetical protein